MYLIKLWYNYMLNENFVILNFNLTVLHLLLIMVDNIIECPDKEGNNLYLYWKILGKFNKQSSSNGL